MHMSSAEIFTPRDTTLNPTEAQQKWAPVLQGAEDLRQIVHSGEHLLEADDHVRLAGSAYRYSDSVLTDPRGTPESVVCFKEGNTTTGYVTKLIPLSQNDYLRKEERLQHQDAIFAAEARLTNLHPENDFAGATLAEDRIFHELHDPAAYAVDDLSSINTAIGAEKASLAQAYMRLSEDAKWAGQPVPQVISHSGLTCTPGYLALMVSVARLWFDFLRCSIVRMARRNTVVPHGYVAHQGRQTGRVYRGSSLAAATTSMKMPTAVISLPRLEISNT